MDACLTPTSMHHHRVPTNSTAAAAAASASPSYFISFAGDSTASTVYFRSNFNQIRASVSYHPFSTFSGNPRAWSTRCRARSPGPPPPPKLEPPSGEDSSSSSSSGALSTFSQVQDAVRIFFAVLFWMSLFFWSCIWDGNNSGGTGKGPRFRR